MVGTVHMWLLSPGNTDGATEQLNFTINLERFHFESWAWLRATALARPQIRLLAPGTKQRQGESEQRPEAQEWAEAVGDMWSAESQTKRGGRTHDIRKPVAESATTAAASGIQLLCGLEF